MYKVTVSKTVNVNSIKYMQDEVGNPLEFHTVKEALCYLKNMNFTFEQILDFDFNFEEV